MWSLLRICAHLLDFASRTLNYLNAAFGTESGKKKTCSETVQVFTKAKTQLESVCVFLLLGSEPSNKTCSEAAVLSKGKEPTIIAVMLLCVTIGSGLIATEIAWNEDELQGIFVQGLSEQLSDELARRNPQTEHHQCRWSPD